MTRQAKLISKALLVLIGAGLGFVVLEGPARALETTAAFTVLHHVNPEGIYRVPPTTFLVVPGDRPAFHVLLTPSCSALASQLAFVCLGPLLTLGTPMRRLAAVATASAVTWGGNALRVCVSIAVGLATGRSSLILFHDWIGSMFTFAFTVGGYMLMLAMLLPANERPHRVAIHA